MAPIVQTIGPSIGFELPVSPSFVYCILFFSPLQAHFLSRIRVSPADTAVTLTLCAERVKAFSSPASAQTASLETDATATVLRPAALVCRTPHGTEQVAREMFNYKESVVKMKNNKGKCLKSVYYSWFVVTVVNKQTKKHRKKTKTACQFIVTSLPFLSNVFFLCLSDRY